jgi:hypothetical protein
VSEVLTGHEPHPRRLPSLSPQLAPLALAVVHGVEVEILEGVEAVGATGDVVVATPDLDHVDRIIVTGRPIPVLPLPAMQVLLDATGNRERAAMIAKVLGGRSSPAGPGART